MSRWMLVPAILMCVAAAQDSGPDKPLCRAAQSGDLAQVRALVARGAKTDIRDANGNTPLMYAASVKGRNAVNRQKAADHLGVARFLVENGAGVGARDQNGRTALLMATEGSASEYRVIGADEPMVRLLIGHGADINARDNEGWSPLLKALNSWADQPSLIEFLLAKGADVNARLKDGRTGLMLTAHLGKIERLPVLIAKGAGVNASDNSGSTALMISATIQWDEQSIGMMKLLIGNGADLNATDKQGRTAADRAAQAGYLDRAKLLLDSGTKVADTDLFLKNARNHALLRAISGGTVETLRVLLDMGADANFRDDTGRTLLMIASSDEYSAERAIALMERGASVNLAGPNGDTALMVAADRYQSEIVKALLDRGANANAVDGTENTVLMRAAASKHSWEEERKPLIHLLLEKGADPARKNAHGVTALMLMALNGNPALALLLEKPLDLNARDEDGNTALLYAARFFVRGWQRRNGWALLEKGADVNAANQKGETALILAATQYETSAAQLLLEKRADVNAKTKTGRTALMQAIDGPKEFDNENHVVYSADIAKLLIAAGADVNARDADGNTAWTLAKKRGYGDMAAILAPPAARVEFHGAERNATLPMEISQNVPFVPAEVNGIKLRFLFDTGASKSVLDSAVAAKLNIHSTRSLEMGASGGKVQSGLVESVTVQAGNALVRDVPFAIVPLDIMSAHFGKHIDGILGYDFIALFVADLDFDAKQITLSTAYTPPATFARLPVELVDKLMYAQVNVTGQQGKTVSGSFMIDTGASGGMLLEGEIAGEHSLLEGAATTATDGRGVGGNFQMLTARAAKIRLAEFEMSNPILGFMKTSTSKRRDGLLGCGILRRFHIVIDYNHRSVYLLKNSRFNDPFKMELSGITPVWKGADFDVLEVESVKPGLAGAQAGLQPADIIETIDGRPAKSFTVDDLSELFRSAGTAHDITVQRRSEHLAVHIQLNPVM